MSDDEERWEPIIPLGLYFKTPNGEIHSVTEVGGWIRDRNGKKHQIRDCKLTRWTQEEIEACDLEAKRLKKIFVKSCCDNEDRTMGGGCKNCGDPSY